MAAQIISFFQRAPEATRDWSQQEVAEFYRVESALVQAGVQLESDRGLSDEGDPWFIFCRGDNGEVFMHFARIDGVYVVDGAAFDEPARGPDFAALIRQLIGRYPLAKARQRTENNIFAHPAALLIALVGAAFFHTNEAKAAEAQDTKVEPRRHSSLLTISTPAASLAFAPATSKPLPETDTAQVAAILLSAVLALHEESLSLPRDLATPMTFETGPSLGGVPEITALTAPHPLNAGLISDEVASGLQTSPSSIADGVVTAFRDLTLAPEVMATTAVSADLSAPLMISEGASAMAPTIPAPLEGPTLGAGASKPIFIVKMSAAPTPSVEAVAVVAATQLSEIVAKALPQMDRLPTTLLDLIGKGDHFDGATPLLPSNAPPQVIGGQTPPGGPVTNAPPPGSPGWDPAIDAAIAQFVAKVKHLDMFMQDRQLVLVDRDIFSPFAPDLDLDSVTFTFKDGSSVSLVGTVDELRHFHWAV